MGLMDNIRGLFSGSQGTKTAQEQLVNDEYEKSRLADRIVDLVDKIKRINSFDNSIWNLSNISSYQLKRKSLEELRRLSSTLESRLAQLKGQTISPERETLEASKWTGQKPKNMTNHDFDRFQKSDDYR